MSELVWLGVPNGERGGSVALRLLVMPRLTSGSLQNEGLAQWPPPDLAAAPLLIDIAEASAPEEVVTTIEVPAPHIEARPGAWEAFFGSIPVNPVGQIRHRSASRVNVRKTTETAAAVRSTYDALARAAVGTFGQTLKAELLSRWGELPAMIATVPVDTGEVAPPPPEVPDFHRVLGMLREHPSVLRAIGLLCQISFPKGAIPEGIADPIVRVRAGTVGVGLPPIASPWTRFGLDFRPASTPGISRGMVALTGEDGTSDDRWQIITVDADNGAERLRQLGARIRGTEAADTGDLRLPAMRSVGLVLVRQGREKDFEERRARSADNGARSSLDGAVLSADDLVLGYRIDIRDHEAEGWRSLHARDAKYTVLGVDEIVLAEGVEEGHVKPLAAIENGSGGLQADEVVATWSGWSLSLPRPSFDRGEVTPPRPVSNTTYRLSWDFDIVEKSLPKLRFGHRYDLRARVADLAGGGLELGDPLSERCTIEGTQYLRHDPISPPEIIVPQGQELTTGESAQHVVIRSDRDMPPETFISQHPAYASSNVREMHPSRSSLVIAEQHGAIDNLEVMEAWGRIVAATGGVGLGEKVAPAVPDYAAAGISAHPLLLPGSPMAIVSDRPWAGDWPEIAPKRVELRSYDGEAQGQLFWEATDQPGGEQLVVCLRPGEQLTVELSSFPRSDIIDHLAVQPALPDDDARRAVSSGRHPLVSPSSVVTFIHAVRKPVSDPYGELLVDRIEGQTYVSLMPEPAMLGIDAASTGQVDLIATWREAGDDPDDPVREAPIQSLVVRQGDLAFRDTIRHEFRDTKHRTVTYYPLAVSRYRAYFSSTEAGESFLAEGEGIEVNIPSSARPPAPRVLDTRPAFEWQETREETPDTLTIVRRRLGRIRVELEGPWQATGADERLAVLVTKYGSAEPGTYNHLSRMGSDPIWPPTSTREWLSLEDVGGEPVADGVRPGGGEVRVEAVAVDPWSGDGLVYADIDLPTLTGSPYYYCPFIELALARYQPNSLAGLECSDVVKSEIVQVLPLREVKLVRSGNQLEVTVAGMAPAGPDRNQVDVVLEGWTGPGTPPEFGVTLLQRWEQDLHGWRSLAVTSQEIGAGPVTFELPSDTKLRLRIREIEKIPAADELIGWPSATTDRELLDRAVFVDVIHLD